LRLVVSPSSPEKILIFAGGRKAVCKVEKDFFIYQSNPKKQSGIDLKIHFGNEFLRFYYFVFWDNSQPEKNI